MDRSSARRDHGGVELLAILERPGQPDRLLDARALATGRVEPDARERGKRPGASAEPTRNAAGHVGGLGSRGAGVGRPAPVLDRINATVASIVAAHQMLG